MESSATDIEGGIRLPAAELPSFGRRSADRRSPEWIGDSALLSRAFSLALAAHRGQTRNTDGQPFLDHVTSVARLLRKAGYDEELQAVGLLHDSVERGTLSSEELQREMESAICDLVLDLSEDPSIASFDDRKAALRAGIAASGERAATVFAADKISDIVGLRWALATFGDSIEARMGTSIEGMAAHYRESVAVIEKVIPSSPFLPTLQLQLERLGRVTTSGHESAATSNR